MLFATAEGVGLTSLLALLSAIVFVELFLEVIKHQVTGESHGQHVDDRRC